MIYTIPVYQFEFYIEQYHFAPLSSSVNSIVISFRFKSNISGITWERKIYIKELKECFLAFTSLEVTFPYQNTIQKTNKGKEIEIYLIELCEYIKQMLGLPYVFNSEHVIKLFGLNNISPITTQMTIPIGSPLPNYGYHVADLLFLNECNVLFVAGHKKETILDTLLSLSPKSSLGQLIVYQYITSSSNYKLIFIQQFKHGITKIEFDTQYNYLTLSFSNGAINLYDFTNCVLNLIASLAPSQNPLEAFTIIDYNKGYLYSSYANDSSIIVSDIENQLTLKVIKISSNRITSVMKIDQQDRMIAAEETGTLILFKINDQLQLETISIKETSITEPMLVGIEKGFNDKDESLLFVANDTIMKMYIIDKRALVLNQRLQLHLLNRHRPTKVIYDSIRSLLIIGDNEGTIQIYSHHYSYPVYLLKVACGSIATMNYDAKRGVIYSSSDKADGVSIVYIPNQYNSDLCYYDQTIINEYIIPNSIEELSSMTLIAKAFGPVITNDDDLSKDYLKQMNEETNTQIEEEAEDYCSTLNLKSNDQTESSNGNNSHYEIDFETDDNISDSSSLDGWNTDIN